MKSILAGFCFALFLAATPASAQNIGAKELWYGLYTVEDVRSVDDPSVPRGQRRVGGTIKRPEVNSARIPHVPGSYFGFGYVLTGAPSSEGIPIRHVQLIPPPGITDNNGKVHDRFQGAYTLNTGRDLFIGVSMGRHTLPGTWTLQVWHQDRLLLERKFEIYQP